MLAPDLLQSPVGLGVHPADEEARYARHLRGVTSDFDESFETPDVGLRHGPVAFKREDQSDVERDTGRDGLLDGRQALFLGRDLDEEVRPVYNLPNKPRACDGPLSVESEFRS